MSTKLVIFDLDGTLLDTVQSLAIACDRALALRSLEQHTIEEYCLMVGNGVSKLVERAVPEHLRCESYVSEVQRDFMKFYTDDIITGTRPYAGVEELLKELESRGVLLAVASNKFQSGTLELVDHFFGLSHFAVVYGNIEGVALKPDSAIVDNILKSTKLKREEVLYVGDSGVDVLTARGAGVPFVGVSWGLRGREELLEFGAEDIIDDAKELISYLK